MTWNYNQLREHIQMQLSRISSENEIRSRLLQEEIDRRFAVEANYRQDMRILLDERYRSQEQAASLAMDNLRERLQSVNAFREQQREIIGSFLPRLEYDTAHSALSEKTDLLKDRLAAMELRLSGRLDRGDGVTEASHTARVDSKQAASVVIAIVSSIVAIVALIAFVTINLSH